MGRLQGVIMNGGTGAGPVTGGSGPVFIKRLEELLVGLRRCSKDLAFYPPGHPAMARSLERTLEQLQSVVDTASPLTIAVTRSGFTFEGRPFGAENRQLASMAAELFVKRIQKIFFAGGVDTEELTAFLRIITSDPKQLLQQGGPGKAMSAQGVRRIQVNEFDFKRLGETPRLARPGAGAPGQATGGMPGPARGSGGKGAADRGAAFGSEGQAGLTGAEMLPGVAATPERSVAPGAPPAVGVPGPGGEALDASATSQTLAGPGAAIPSLGPGQDQTVEALIQRLEREGEAGHLAEYELVASRLVAAAGNAARSNRLGDLLAVLRVFVRHRQAEGPLAPPLRECAAQSVEAAASGEALAYLVNQWETPEGAMEPDLTPVLLALGGRVVSLLLDRLATQEEAEKRGRGLASVAQFGEAALPGIAEAMKKADRDLASELAACLGQIGGEGSVTLLARLSRHEEATVRAQAVRGLGRVGGPSAHRLLVQALRDSDQAVLELAIGYLGASRVRQALPALQRLAEQPALSGTSFAVRKAAVAALGAVGDPAAVPVLAGLLHTRTWFRRGAGDELRRAAALALLTLATPEAREALDSGARSSRADVRRACSAALQKLMPAPGA
jgi:HEAT repeat protein